MAEEKFDVTTKKGRKAFVKSSKWLPYLQKKYGWLLSVYDDVPEIATIIRRGYIDDEPPAEIKRYITDSTWANNLQAGEYNYIKGMATNNAAFMAQVAARETAVQKIAKEIGYDLPESEVKLIAANSIKGAWDTNTISESVAKSVTEQQKAKPQAPPAEATPTGLQTGADASSIRTTAKKYGLTLTDSQVEGYVQSFLRGEVSTQQIVDQFRNQAKSLYPSIASQLDAGDLDSSVASYKSTAASVLGIDASQVDFTNQKFSKLLTYQDPANGNPRLMNSTEWNNYLRTLPEWKKTAEASTSYDTMIKTIDDLFGKVR